MRRALVGCGLLIVLVPTLAYLGLVTRRPVSEPASYWVVDDRTIGVLIESPGGIECDVASTTESATDVRVRSECLEPFWSLGGTADLWRHVTTVSLTSPLAQRIVIDGTGRPATRCESETACG